MEANTKLRVCEFWYNWAWIRMRLTVMTMLRQPLY
jgi:hypothetical protein